MPFGKMLPKDILAIKDHTGIRIVENFKLLGIEFNNIIRPDDLKDSSRKVILKGMNSKYKIQKENNHPIPPVSLAPSPFKLNSTRS